MEPSPEKKVGENWDLNRGVQNVVHCRQILLSHDDVQAIF